MTERSSVLEGFFRPKLALRLGLALSLAILPLGLISVFQTYEVLQERQDLSETALLAQTQQAFSESRDMIHATLTVGRTLSDILNDSTLPFENCEGILRGVVEREPAYVFAGFVDPDLNVTCASDGVPPSARSVTSLGTELGSREIEVVMHSLEFAAGLATVSVLVPVFDGGEYRGVIWIAIQMNLLIEKLAEAAPDVDLVVFRTDGEIIATADYTDMRRAVLPENTSLADLAAIGRHTFRDNNRFGVTRDFAVVPLVPDKVFALGSWEPHQSGLVQLRYEQMFALYFPLLIWAITIAVAYIWVHYLVIRHVRRLRSWMRLYAAGRGDLDNARLDNAPDELEVVAESFRAMTRRLSEQEREREADLREKTVLLREVHHRVKNNLQLIASMLNMQIRATKSAEAKHLLRRVQDRVMALSAIHRYLYMARNLSLVRADTLLDGIIQQLVIVGTLDESGRKIGVATQFDAVEISPDQSVPLSLLTTEAAINAVKYCGVTTGADAWINIALKDMGDGNYGLSVVNSYVAPTEAEIEAQDPDYGSGLGSKLIESFVAQLNGTLEINQIADRYELHVVFPVKWHVVDEDN
ncbi:MULTISPECIES: sensor histidine kinase [unclassified Yoonia]|uniref:sensor histidine kinase n=1 Tax=unclassified Yoonia TaxID=2629118 RepID=UPI002AFDFFAC|nr:MULTISPECIES: histidine kinase dimerization/phosphoacceptor domain -containing protein [unclassified Yoonia]